MDVLNELEDILLDDDGNFVEASDGDCVTVTGADVVVQDIKHELLTYPGTLWLHPEYGSIVQLYRQTENTILHQKELIQEIRMVIERHSNVAASSIQISVASWDMQEIAIHTEFEVQDAETLETEPAALTIIIDQDGVHVWEG